MGKIFNSEQKEAMKHEIKRLYGTGLTYVDCCSVVGISPDTLLKWKREDPYYKKALDNVRDIMMRNRVENGINKLIEGGESKEEKIEYIEKRMINGEEVPCKVTRTIKKHMPDYKALMSAARKYAPELSEQKDANIGVNIRITQRDRTLSMEERKKLLLEDVECNDFKVLDDLIELDEDVSI